MPKRLVAFSAAALPAYAGAPAGHRLAVKITR